jgi:hypothetical protein
MLETAKGGRKSAADMPTMHCVVQAAMNTHLSQSIDAGALAGQHGISPDMPSMAVDIDASSANAELDVSGVVPAMAGRDSGANTRPAIIKIASNRRMVIWQFTGPKSHRCRENGRHPT